MSKLFSSSTVFLACAFGFAATAHAGDAPTAGTADHPILGGCGRGEVSLGFILRQDFTDISLFECPTAPNIQRAIGSRISLTFDELAHTTSVSVDGLAAGAVRYYRDPQTDGPFRGIEFGPYLQGNEMYQFSSPTAPSKTSDTMTAGGYTEFGFGGSEEQNYFRIRGGEVFGSSGTGSETFVGEWIPVYDTWHIGTSYSLHGTDVVYQFSPELMVQYDQLEYGPNKYLLFFAHNDALRIGPEVVLKLWLDSRLITDPFWQNVADKTTFTVTYHASQDAYSGRNYSWLQPVLTYNLDDAGHFALSASYGYGNLEATANMASQFKMGLAGKF